MKRPSADPGHGLRVDVWVNSGGTWMAHFHQKTAAMEMGK